MTISKINLAAIDLIIAKHHNKGHDWSVQEEMEDGDQGTWESYENDAFVSQELEAMAKNFEFCDTVVQFDMDEEVEERWADEQFRRDLNMAVIGREEV